MGFVHESARSLSLPLSGLPEVTPADPELARCFSAAGALARAVPDFRPRAQQLEMAQAVAQAIASHGVLVAEAGTGTGKTFAYLVPALRSGGKVIVSTGTKTLQDQLFSRDIPMVKEALGLPARVALLKGRSNYVCHHHLQRALQEGRFASRRDVIHLHLIDQYARATTSGDRTGLSDVPEDAAVWPAVTSTRDNCLGSECAFHKDCFVIAARKQAMDADVVVVNHHLFFADVMLRDEGVSELLPACNTVIFDEAHQLPETASLFFGESVSTSQLLDLARDSRAEGIASARDFTALPDAAAALEKAAKDFRLAAGDDAQRQPAHAALRRREFADALAEAADRLGDLGELLASQAERSAALANCAERAAEIAARIGRWREGEAEGMVRWVETYSQSLQLNATPLSVADVFRRQLEGSPRAWVFTSATLSVRGDFGHYCGELGLEAAVTRCWDSPFDYGRQGVLYVPEGLPDDPNSEGYTEAVVAAALPVLRASRGRAFLLFTSLKAMRRAHRQLDEAFRREGLAFPILLQGELPRSRMLELFRNQGNAVLVGSQTFWEGVDVRGPALSVVVIDKLPFASPDDPVLAARVDRMNREGRNAFMDYQLPHAIITLKQGAGRLIRDENDRGVLMICDPRLIAKGYGRRIWQSLPPMRRSRDLAAVTDFLESECG
ncbi:MAG TPA: ATP-dependent DNA helicase [Burkholderiales bacterium]|nr:ATP-dependent DNA helicase [Burkholderiales bacterium]